MKEEKRQQNHVGSCIETRHFSSEKNESSRRRSPKPWPLSGSIFDRFDITLLLISGQNGSHYPNNASRARLSDRKRKLRRYARIIQFSENRRDDSPTSDEENWENGGHPVVSRAAIQFSMTRGFSRLLRDIEADCSQPCICLARYRTDVCLAPLSLQQGVVVVVVVVSGARSVDRYSRRGSKRASLHRCNLEIGR